MLLQLYSVGQEKLRMKKVANRLLLFTFRALYLCLRLFSPSALTLLSQSSLLRSGAIVAFGAVK